MKKLILTILFLIVAIESNNVLVSKNELKRSKADFRLTYSYIRSYEGNYVNDPLDRGGETYAGITKKWNKDWYGWRHIDKSKRERHDLVPEAEFWALDYYLDIWVKEGWYELYNQQVANYLFDFRVNGPTLFVKMLEKALFELKGLKLDNKITVEDIETINKIPSGTLLDRLRKARYEFYQQLVKKDSTQSRFLEGWLNRANSVKINS